MMLWRLGEEGQREDLGKRVIFVSNKLIIILFLINIIVVISLETRHIVVLLCAMLLFCGNIPISP